MVRLGLSVLIALLVNGIASGQTPQPYATRTDRVVITAVVTDEADQFVPGLQQGDFEVLEDGRPREIRHFETGRVPVSIALLLDTSASMWQVGDRWSVPRAVVSTLVREMAPGDEAAVFVFDERPRELSGWTDNLRPLLQQLTRVPNDGKTALFRSISSIIPALDEAHNRRKALIIVSDGIDTDSMRGDLIAFARAAESLRKSETIVYAIGVDRVTRADSLTLESLARPTGGNTEIVSSVRRAEAAVGRVLGDLRDRYVLSFDASAADGKFHKVLVKTVNSRHRVRHRTSYLAADGR